MNAVNLCVNKGKVGKCGRDDQPGGEGGIRKGRLTPNNKIEEERLPKKFLCFAIVWMSDCCTFTCS